jgi:GAF domain-containing protein
LAIGSILAFGKYDATFFSEEDELLASFIGVQTGTAIEGNWLYTELRNSMTHASALYQLSNNIIHAEELNDTLTEIVSATQKLLPKASGGLVLFNRQAEVEACVGFDPSEVRFDVDYPIDLVKQAMETKQAIIVAVEQGSEIYYPLYTQYRTYGVLWLKVPPLMGANFANFQTLAYQASISIERLILIQEARQQLKQVKGLSVQDENAN